MELIIPIIFAMQFVFIKPLDEVTVALKTGDDRYSATVDDVFIQINGTEGNLSKTAISITVLEISSTQYKSFDQDVGEPYMVTVYKPGRDLWELKYINVSVRGKEYVFPYDRWMTEYTWKSSKPRPDVSIMRSCQLSDRSIRCEGNYIIDIIDADYGRWDENTCPPSDKSNCNKVDVQAIFKSHCNGMSQCHFSHFQDMYIDKACISSYTMVIFQCSIQASVAVKTGNNNYSGTSNGVFMKIYGTKEDIALGSGKLSFPSDSTKTCKYNNDIGDPFMIMVNKPGDDDWELETINVSVGIKTFVFPLSCWMNDFVTENIPEPRPVLYIVTHCQHSDMLIRCAGNEVINIINAYYGRWDNYTCPPSNTSTCENVNVLGILKGHCNGRSQCDLKSVHDTFRELSCVSSYTVIVFQCITRVNWTITVKTGEIYGYSGSTNDKIIKLHDDKGRTQEINITRDLAAGSLECFDVQSSIVVPSRLAVFGKPDEWELEYISFAIDVGSFVFTCNCIILEANQTIVLNPEIEMATQNGTDLGYCSWNSTTVSTTAASTGNNSFNYRTSLTSTATTFNRQTSNTQTTTAPTTPTSETKITEASSKVSNATKGNNSYSTNESLCCSYVTDCNSKINFDDVECSLDDVTCVVSALREKLIVDIQSTSSFKRKKISAHDARTSSQMIGASGAFSLVAVLLAIILPDIISLINCICTRLCKRNKRKKDIIQRVNFEQI